MGTYFNILPKELLHKILYNFYDNKDLRQLKEFEVFKNVIEDPYFWNEKVRYDFSSVDFDLLPDYLYKFKALDGYGIYINHYRKLYQSYVRAIKNFGEVSGGQRTVDASLSAINNFEALHLFEQNYLDNWKIDKILELYQYELFLPGSDEDGYRIVELSLSYSDVDLYTITISPNTGRDENISYDINSEQAFNLLLHLCISGWN